MTNPETAETNPIVTAFETFKRTINDGYVTARGSGERRIMIAVLSEMEDREYRYKSEPEKLVREMIAVLDNLAANAVGYGRQKERVMMERLSEELRESAGLVEEVS